jgi:hypothetical protein
MRIYPQMQKRAPAPGFTIGNAAFDGSPENFTLRFENGWCVSFVPGPRHYNSALPYKRNTLGQVLCAIGEVYVENELTGESYDFGDDANPNGKMMRDVTSAQYAEIVAHISSLSKP